MEGIDALLGGTYRREISINRTDGHIGSKSHISQISILKSFHQLIYRSINRRTHWHKGADNRKEKTHNQDRMEEYTGGADAST